MNRRSVTIAAAAAIVLSLTSAAVRGQAPSAPRTPMAEEVFKNIQVLKGIPVDQFLGAMGIIAAATARGCSECHRQDGPADWTRYADDTPMKQVTRQMLLMTQEINRTHFGGRQVITCYSCHRGMHRPRVTPSLVALYAAPPDEPDDIVDPAPGAPPADQIFNTYLAAIGGASRVASLTSFTARGTYQAYDEDAIPLRYMRGRRTSACGYGTRVWRPRDGLQRPRRLDRGLAGRAAAPGGISDGSGVGRHASRGGADVSHTDHAGADGSACRLSGVHQRSRRAGRSGDDGRRDAGDACISIWRPGC